MSGIILFQNDLYRLKQYPPFNNWKTYSIVLVGCINNIMIMNDHSHYYDTLVFLVHPQCLSQKINVSTHTRYVSNCVYSEATHFQDPDTYLSITSKYNMNYYHGHTDEIELLLDSYA